MKRMITILALATLAAACERPPDPLDPGDAPVVSVEVAPSELTLRPGESLRLEATLRTGDGRKVTGRSILWTSLGASVASVDESGTVTGRRAGTATVLASNGGRQGSATVIVRDREAVATLEITPGGVVQLEAGGRLRLIATARAADGAELSGRTVEWSTSDGAVAQVGATGEVAGRGAGQAVITARCEGRAATVTVRVTSQLRWVEVVPAAMSLTEGEVGQLNALPRTQGGHVLNLPVVWSSESPDVATVSASGRVTARKPGIAVITATVEGKIGRSYVSVANWRELRLRRVAGLPVPAVAFGTTRPDASGTSRTTQWEVREGILRLLDQARYELRLTVWVRRDGSEPAETRYVSRGEVGFRVPNGEYVFYPENEDPEFEGTVVQSGGVSVVWMLFPGAPQVEFGFEPV